MTLSGKTILITRSAQQAGEFVSLVKQHGGIPIVFPTIDITSPASWEACDRALQGLYLYDGLIFTSTNGVDLFTKRMAENQIPVEQLRAKLVFVVGEKTKCAIEKHGCTVTTMPDKFTAMELARALQQEDLHGKCFLFPCGDLANTTLADNVKLLGGQVDQVVVYRTQRPRPENVDELKHMLLGGKIDIITFTSPSTVKNFASLIGAAQIREVEKPITVAVIGPATAKVAGTLGFTVDVVAEQSTVDSLVETIMKYLQSFTERKQIEPMR